MIYGSGDNEISDGTPPIEGSEGRGERSTVNGDEVTGGWWTWLEGREGRCPKGRSCRQIGHSALPIHPWVHPVNRKLIRAASDAAGPPLTCNRAFPVHACTPVQLL
jgi:hypothetical protein